MFEKVRCWLYIQVTKLSFELSEIRNVIKCFKIVKETEE